MSEFQCQKCGSVKIKKIGKPKFYWATFAINGVQPINIQKLQCKDCNKIFGCVETELEDLDTLMEIQQ